jgi:2-octaprenylphenol hydroxylase
MTTATAAAPYDVVIIGGGPVGGTLGALLLRAASQRPLRVLLLERDLPRETGDGDKPMPSSEPHDLQAPRELRVSALSRASERVLGAAGAWEAIRAGRISPYERMHVWPEQAEPRGPGSLRFDAAELSEPNLGYIIENRRVQRAALQAFTATGGVLRSGELQGIEFGARHVTLATTGGAIAARLVVGADGARSVVRGLAGLPADRQDYGQRAIVANVQPVQPHEHTAWQRFLGDGTLALLPLDNGQCSIVWSLPNAEAAARLACDPAQFSAALTDASANVLGELVLQGERLAFPLQRLDATSYARERCVLVGDAAHVVHPLAGQGVNLGLLDAAALAQCLAEASAEHEDPGALRVLRRYERWRKSENEMMATAMDAFNRFLAFGRDPVSRLAQRGLGWVDRSSMLRRFFVERALGVAGDLPDVARGGGGAPR